MAPTTFHLVRHGSYGLLGRVLAGRTAGHSLNEQGLREARAVAERLGERDIAAVIASPLERARETAAAIAERRGLPVEIEQGVTEIDFGEWTGAGFTELHGNPVWREFNRFRSTVAPPGGETMLEVQQRGVAAILRLHARFPGRELVIVSHGDLIKAVLAHFLAMPLDLFQRIEIAPASRSVVRLFAADVRVDGVNLPA